jgi:regulator of sigma E protease
LLSILAFIFVLGVMIFVHELGHFLTAKWIGVKVHVFSLGFPPKLIGKKWGDTEYRIGMVPLGGYVKMAGEQPEEIVGLSKLQRRLKGVSQQGDRWIARCPNDPLGDHLLTIVRAAHGNTQIQCSGGCRQEAILSAVEMEPQDLRPNLAEFYCRSKLERTAILVMGPAMNIFLTVFLFTILFMVGIPRPVGLDDPPVVRFVSDDSPAVAAGVEPGDRIVAIDEKPMENWLQVLDTFHISPNQTLSLSLERDGETIETELQIEARGKEQVGYTGLFPAVQPRVEDLSKGYPAAEAGLEQGDLIIKVDDEPIFSNQQLIEAIESKRGDAVTLTILREGNQREIAVTPVAEGDRFLIGIALPSPVAIQQIGNPFKALGAAIGECVRITRLTFVVLGRLIQRKLSMRQMMGPVGIAQASGEAARSGARNLFTLMAVISLQLGIFNLLPVPVLDGGHIAIILLEGLARRDFSLQVKERVLQVGFVLLLLLMVTVIYFDLSKIESVGRFLP